MQEGTLVSWLVGDGQPVGQGQPIAEIETDLELVTYAAPEGGVLRILVPEGTYLSIGESIGLIDDLTPLPGGHSVAPPGVAPVFGAPVLPPRDPQGPGATDSYALQPDHHAPHTVHASVPPPAEPARSPAWGPAGQTWAGDDEGETTEFAALDIAPDFDDYDPPTDEHPVAPAQPSAPADAGAPWIDPHSGHQPQQAAPVTPPPPAAPEMPAAPDPEPVAQAAPPAPAEADDAGRYRAEELMAPPTLPPRPPAQRPAPTQGAGRVHASPVARRLAEQLGIDLATITGTGPDGRVTRADIEAAQAQGLARPPVPTGALPTAPSDFTPPPASEPGPIPEVEPTPEPEPVAEPEPVVEPVPAPEPEVQEAAEATVAAEPPAPTPDPAPATPPAPEPEPEQITPPAAEPPAASRDAVVLPAAQPGGGRGEPRLIELTRQQQNIARRMAEAKATIPHFALQLDVDAEAMLALRGELATTRPDLSPPSITDLVVRAAALALRAHPRLNGAYRDGRVEEYPRINIGIAREHDGALIVPVVQDVDRISLGQLAERTAELTEKLLAGELRPADLASATFTVANLGGYGVEAFTAVITPGQAAMLTVGAVTPRAVVRQGQVVVRQTATLTVLGDHRAMYGSVAAEFLGRVRQLLEHPTALLA